MDSSPPRGSRDVVGVLIDMHADRVVLENPEPQRPPGHRTVSPSRFVKKLDGSFVMISPDGTEKVLREATMSAGRSAKVNRPVHAAAEWLLMLAGRRLPAPVRAERAREWTGELYAIVHDADRTRLYRTYRGLLYAGGLVLASGRLAPRSGTSRRSGPRRAIDRWPTVVANAATRHAGIISLIRRLVNLSVVVAGVVVAVANVAYVVAAVVVIVAAVGIVFAAVVAILLRRSKR